MNESSPGDPGENEAHADFASLYWRDQSIVTGQPSEITAANLGDESFRLLADNIPTLCWVADGTGYIIWYNRRWHQYCGSTPEAMEGWGWQAVHHPETLPSVMERWVHAIAVGEPFEMTFPLRGADGVFRPFLTRIHPARDEQGAIIRWFGTNTEISDQIAAEEALRVERDRSRGVLENMAEGFLLLDREFRVLDINAEGLKLETRPITEIVGQTHWAVWPGTEHSELGDFYKRLMATRTRGEIDHRYMWPDGREVWLEARAFPTNDGLAIFYRDVSDRKIAEMRLRDSEARFRTVAETMPGFVWTADEAGQLDYTSPNWLTYSGTTADASNGQGWANFVHPEDQADAFEQWGASVATTTPYEVEFRLRRADGVYRWWLARARPVSDAGRTIWIGTCTDLNDIIAARELLASSSEELQHIVDSRTQERDRIWRMIPDLLMAGTLDGRILSVNPAWKQSLGHEENTLLSTPFWEFVHPDSHVESVRAIESMRGGEIARHENRVVTADGDYRWFDWVSTPVGELFYAVARDITDDKLMQAELEHAQEALRQSQKMEAVGQLTGGIAHDFNNMLAVIIGSLDLLSRRMGSEDARSRRYVDAAADGARRAAILTQRLLAFSRQQPLQPETVDVNRLVANMSDLLRHSLGTDVRLETILAGGLWQTHVDPNQLENVILNLGVNARDAMPDGGRLTIETHNGHLDMRYATAHIGVPEGQYVVIAVTDTGTGMPPEVIAKAFDPFFTTKEVGKGTGLGLSQVYGFVKQSGGHVKIYSETGEGTTVKIYLPRLIGAADEVKANTAPTAIAKGYYDELILVVEDEPAVRQLSVDALTELGYRVVEADGAAAGLRLLDAHPEIMLLFTDIVMPDVNGAKLAEEARRRRPRLKVLFTTGYTRNAVVHNGMLDPGVDLIGKPFTIEELAAKVRQVLDAPVEIAGAAP